MSSEKNNLSIIIKTLLNNLEVNSESFIFNGQQYQFKEISGIRFYSIKKYNTNVRTGGEMRLELQVDGRSKNIKVKQTTLFRHKSQKYDNLLKAYALLSEESYEFRLDRYLKSINEFGYFLYNDTQFHKDGTIVQKKLSCNIFQLSNEELDFNRGADFYRLWDYPHLILNKGVGGFLKRKEMYIQVDWDRDVFLSLIYNLYNIRLS